MAAIVLSDRYNWMGYNGTETREIDKVFLRGGNDGGIFDYWRRRSVLEDIRKRLRLIKGELDLIPEEELQAEREAARRRREAREAAARERQAQESRAGSRPSNDDAAAGQEPPMSEEEFEQRMREIMQRTAGISEAECNKLLENMPRTQDEVDAAVSSFGAGARGLLVGCGAYYVSHLDGSWHTSLEKLEAHNEKYQGPTERALRDSGVSLPLPEEHSTAPLWEAAERLSTAQKKLRAYFCQQDPILAGRLRKADKNEQGDPAMELAEDDGDEKTLRRNVEDALADMVSLREVYNRRSAACGQRLASVTINSREQ